MLQSSHPRVSPDQVAVNTGTMSQPNEHILLKQNQKKRLLLPPDQLTLFDTLPLPQPVQSQYESTWGHSMDSIELDGVFCIVTQNPRGVKLYNDPILMQYSLQLI